MTTEETEKTHSWGYLASLTHQTQLNEFGFCLCEDNEGNENPYHDCPETVMSKYDLWVDTETGTYGGGPITLLSWAELPVPARAELDAAVESGDEAVIVRIANGYGWSA